MFSRPKLLLSAAFVCGAFSSLVFGDISSNPAIARFVFIAESIMSSPVVPDRPDEPVSDICENCDGRGKLGDGRVEKVCPVCDGTGKNTRSKAAGWPPKSSLTVIVPDNPNCECDKCDCVDCECGEPEPVSEYRHNEIIVYTMPNCPACEVWKQRYMSDLLSKGWKVTEQPVEPRHTAAPSFRVWLKDEPHDWETTTSGKVMTMIDLKRLMRTGSFDVVQQRRFTSAPSNYQARWTYPSPLSSHLQGWPHNMDTSGMSTAEMKAAHDAHHDKIGPISAAQLRANNPPRTTTNCPGGNCPTRQTYTRRGLFGGLFR